MGDIVNARKIKAKQQKKLTYAQFAYLMCKHYGFDYGKVMRRGYTA